MITNIKLEKLCPHPNNPRKDLGDLSELTESVKVNGIVQNLTVVPYLGEVTGQPIEGLYRIIIGHRRHAAAKFAGLDEVPCAIVDMDERAQMAMMLLENIQRSDLTVYEQAHGFQMMLDLGDSIQGIATQTGFSDSTIRRRVKLMELDQERFSTAVQRGATLMDFAEMDKIEDVNLRNNVLKEFGTQNFQWALRQAIDTEKAQKNAELYIADIEKFATLLGDNGCGRQYVTGYQLSGEYKKVPVPEDADTVKYFYNVSSYYVSLYKEYTFNEEDAAEAKRRQQKEEKNKALREVASRAYKLRKEFVKNFNGAKDHMTDIVKFALPVIKEYKYNFDKAAYDLIFGASKKKDINKILNTIPERALLVTVYCKYESENHTCKNWNGDYVKSKDLDQLYDFLAKFGYQISDEEQALRDGTHELFMQEDKPAAPAENVKGE